ncbi:MAG: 50S ribosomal protein L17 [Candidatus Nealsonbacteria bacterium]|nr:50S ribosomal protein L17 [Candidatus Nealsonbacteria bacterium]
MKKRKKGRKLSRVKDQRKALLRSLSRELVLRGRIKTTEAKAKELAGFIEKKITQAKEDNLQTRRLLAKHFSDEVVKKLVEEIAPKYKERPGGYTRILKLPSRKSDAARMAIIELV